MYEAKHWVQVAMSVTLLVRRAGNCCALLWLSADFRGSGPKTPAAAWTCPQTPTSRYDLPVCLELVKGLPRCRWPRPSGGLRWPRTEANYRRLLPPPLQLTRRGDLAECSQHYLSPTVELTHSQSMVSARARPMVASCPAAASCPTAALCLMASSCLTAASSPVLQGSNENELCTTHDCPSAMNPTPTRRVRQATWQLRRHTSHAMQSATSSP